jgi:hypothetical protein
MVCLGGIVEPIVKKVLQLQLRQHIVYGEINANLYMGWNFICNHETKSNRKNAFFNPTTLYLSARIRMDKAFSEFNTT